MKVFLKMNTTMQRMFGLHSSANPLWTLRFISVDRYCLFFRWCVWEISCYCMCANFIQHNIHLHRTWYVNHWSPNPKFSLNFSLKLIDICLSIDHFATDINIKPQVCSCQQTKHGWYDPVNSMSYIMYLHPKIFNIHTVVQPLQVREFQWIDSAYIDLHTQKQQHVHDRNTNSDHVEVPRYFGWGAMLPIQFLIIAEDPPWLVFVPNWSSD